MSYRLEPGAWSLEPGSAARALIVGELDVLAPGTMVRSDEIIAECEYFVVAPNH